MAQKSAAVLLAFLALASPDPAEARDHHDQLFLDQAGQVALVVINGTDDVPTATGGYGTFTLTGATHRPKDAAAVAARFMQGLDPQNFLAAKEPKAVGAKPDKLSYMISSNLTVHIDNIQVSCGALRWGYDGDWWVGAPHCVKSQLDPKPDPKKPMPEPEYALSCTCDEAVALKFTQAVRSRHPGQHLSVSIDDCTAVKEKTGAWVPVASSPGGQELDLSYGVQRSYTVQKTQTWSRSTTVSVSAGFNFGHASASITVSHETSYKFGVQHSSTFSMTTTEDYKTTLAAGTVWQFQMAVSDNCGLSNVLMRDFQVTNSSVTVPCCLPGYFKNVQDPLGDCVAAHGDKVYNTCKTQQQPFIPAIVV